MRMRCVSVLCIKKHLFHLFVIRYGQQDCLFQDLVSISRKIMEFAHHVLSIQWLHTALGLFTHYIPPMNIFYIFITNLSSC